MSNSVWSAMGASLGRSSSSHCISGGNAMKFPRRTFLHLAAGAAALPAISRFAWAQAYPTRPVRFIVPVVAGGSTDTVARLVGEHLSRVVGQQFIVDNRSAAGGTAGMEAVAKSAPDGYTLL